MAAAGVVAFLELVAALAHRSSLAPGFVLSAFEHVENAALLMEQLVPPAVFQKSRTL